MKNNCGSKYEKFCREYNYIVISDIMLDVVPFLKIQNCKAKIITEITNRYEYSYYKLILLNKIYINNNNVLKFYFV